MGNLRTTSQLAIAFAALACAIGAVFHPGAALAQQCNNCPQPQFNGGLLQPQIQAIPRVNVDYDFQMVIPPRQIQIPGRTMPLQLFQPQQQQFQPNFGQLNLGGYGLQQGGLQPQVIRYGLFGRRRLIILR